MNSDFDNDPADRHPAAASAAPTLPTAGRRIDFMHAMCATLAAAALAGLTGCVVAPLPPPRAVVYGPPPGVAYVAPAYAVPGPGYAWEYNARYGWGYHHPRYGWHRGWQ